jgi:hypothetical protein
VVGVDITSLNLEKIRDDLGLESGNTEEIRLRNLQRLSNVGYSVKQQNFIAEWAMQVSATDIANGASRESRGVEDNPFVDMSETEAGDLVVAGHVNSATANQAPIEPRFIHSRYRNVRMATDPNAPDFLGGDGGEVADSPALPASPNYPQPNDLAPKFRGYRGGNTQPPMVNVENGLGGIVNPPPEMQERMLTVEEVQKLRQDRGHSNDPYDVPPNVAPAAVPQDFGVRPAHSPSNLPTTPETAQKDVIPSGTVTENLEQNNPEMPDSPLFAKGNEAADAIASGEQSGSNQPEYTGNGESGPSSGPGNSGSNG